MKASAFHAELRIRHGSPESLAKKYMNADHVGVCLMNLVAEVQNGGFSQFFFNSSGDYSADILVALEEIGSKEKLEIAKRAFGKWPGGLPPQDRFERQRLLDEIAPDGSIWTPEDNDFYASKEDLAYLYDAFKKLG